MSELICKILTERHELTMLGPVGRGELDHQAGADLGAHVALIGFDLPAPRIVRHIRRTFFWTCTSGEAALAANPRCARSRADIRLDQHTPRRAQSHASARASAHTHTQALVHI